MPLSKKMKDRSRQLNAVFKTFPYFVAREAEEHFKSSFESESWEGSPWPNRKREPRQGSRRTRGQRGLLIRSGRLLDSIESTEISAHRVVVEAGYTVGKRSRYNLGQIHNEGLAPVPQRKFMGDSPLLRKKIKLHLTKRLRLALTR